VKVSIMTRLETETETDTKGWSQHVKTQNQPRVETWDRDQYKGMVLTLLRLKIESNAKGWS